MSHLEWPLSWLWAFQARQVQSVWSPPWTLERRSWTWRSQAFSSSAALSGWTPCHTAGWPTGGKRSSSGWWRTQRCSYLGGEIKQFTEAATMMVSSYAGSHHQTDTGWCCWRPPAGRKPGDGSGGRRRGTRVWKKPPGGGAACWLRPWRGSSDKVKLWRNKEAQRL